MVRKYQSTPSKETKPQVRILPAVDEGMGEDNRL